MTFAISLGEGASPFSLGEGMPHLPSKKDCHPSIERGNVILSLRKGVPPFHQEKDCHLRGIHKVYKRFVKDI